MINTIGWRENIGPLNQTYTYDQAYRLVQADGVSGISSYPNNRYRYDAAGNRTTWGNEESSGTIYNRDAAQLPWQITQMTDDANRVTAIDEVNSATKKVHKAFTYEDNGNLRSELWTRTGFTDACVSGGAPSNSIGTYFDDAGLLVSRRATDTTLTTNRTNVSTYTYDGDGQRMSQLYQQTDYTGGVGSCTAKPVWSEFTAYEYANGEVLNERTAGNVPVWYIRDSHGALLYTLHWVANQLKPDVYVKDHLGSVRMIIDYQGNVANTYKYDAYGAITSSATTLRNSYTFTGYGLDARTGLYYAKARYYRPDMGRFMSQDTWKGSPWKPWTQNLYVYVHNNPVNFVDPTGHKDDDGGGGGGGLLPWLIKWLTEHPDAEEELVAGSEAAAAEVQFATRSDLLADIAKNGLKVTETIERLWEKNPSRWVPTSAIEQAVESGREFMDPQGAENARVFFTTIERNGEQVGLKVVFDMVNKVALHVHYDANIDKMLKSLIEAGEIYN